MNTCKLHAPLERSVKGLTLKDGPLETRVLEAYRRYLHPLSSESFPSYLRTAFVDLKRQFEALTDPKTRNPESRDPREPGPSKATEMAETILYLYQEVQTHRAPFDPNHHFEFRDTMEDRSSQKTPSLSK